MKRLYDRIGKHLFYLLFFSLLFSFPALLLSKSFPEQAVGIRIAAAALFLFVYLLRLYRCKRHHRCKTYYLVTLAAFCLYVGVFALVRYSLPTDIFSGCFYVTRVFTLWVANGKYAYGLFFGILFAATLLFYPLHTGFCKLADDMANFRMRLYHLEEPLYLSTVFRRVARPIHHFLSAAESRRFQKLFALEFFLLMLFSSLISSLGYLILTRNLLKANQTTRHVSMVIITLFFLLYYIFHLARFAGLHRKATYYRVCICSYLAFAALDFLLFATTKVNVNHYFFMTTHLTYYFNRDYWHLVNSKYVALLIQHILTILLIPVVRALLVKYASYAAHKDPLWMRFDKFTDNISESLEHPSILLSHLTESSRHHHHHHHHHHHSESGEHHHHSESGNSAADADESKPDADNPSQPE